MNISRFLGFLLCLMLGSSSWAAAKGKVSYALQEGDIVFSGSARGQGEAIIAATESPYTHCGVVFEKDGELMVLEAVQPVGVTTLKAYNLDRPAVRKIIEQRYGGMDRLPMNEKAVDPSDLAASSLLAEVPRKKRLRNQSGRRLPGLPGS